SITLFFSCVFPFAEQRPILRNQLLIWLPAVILPVLVLTNQVVRGNTIMLDGVIKAIYGPAYIFFVAYALVYLALAFLNFYKKTRILAGFQKIQVKYIFLGIFLSAILVLTTNVIMPFIGLSGLTWLGPYTSIIMLVCTAYAIVKHRLLSVEVVLQRGMVYVVVTIVLIVLYVAVANFFRYFLRGMLGGWQIFALASISALLAIAYHPVVVWLQTTSEKIFLGERFDYQKAIREVSKAITSIIKLEDLARAIVTTFIDTMHVSEISFLILDIKKSRFRSVPVELKEGIGRYKRIEIDENSPIVSWLRVAKDILILDEVENEIAKLNIADSDLAVRRKLLSDIMDEMRRIGMNVWVPILFKKELTGIICLGSKLSGGSFTSEDLDLLGALANQTALALENARLYAEVLNMKNYSEEILNSMVSGVLTTDMRGDVITFNPTAEEITGCKANNVVGKNYKNLFQSGCAFDKYIEKALNNTTVSNKEDAFISYEKGKVPVSISTNLLYDGQGKKIGILLSMMDLSEVKELENKVRRADKLGALGTMAAGMAHEIKNPLSSMKVLSQLLPVKFQDEEFRKKFIDIMPKEINRIDRIVESLLGFARASAPKFEQVDMNRLLDEQIKYYQRQADEAKIKILKKFSDIPPIMGDHDQLVQVFSNLILNAIHAMPNGGHLVVETAEGKKIENEVQDIVVIVSDSGHGIAPDHLKKLFDPFFTTKYAGTGLGLTISHSIIDGHRGSIDVKSELGKGTTFKVSLPRSSEDI
ncbi:MAG: PAS domain S-box protein, partial [Candidatus Margulisbacteria bacterium]|nr:PAS domain S-box protein [Candidatus Margulisiibacteriota bacterium]